MALIEFDVPVLFVSVADTPVIPVRFPLMVNCCAKVNRLPYCVEVGSLNHVPNS